MTTIRGKSAAAFAQIFVNLLDEIKDSLRQSIFMKLFDFKVNLTRMYFVAKFERSFWLGIGCEVAPTVSRKLNICCQI